MYKYIDIYTRVEEKLDSDTIFGKAVSKIPLKEWIERCKTVFLWIRIDHYLKELVSLSTTYNLNVKQNQNSAKLFQNKIYEMLLYYSWGVKSKHIRP